MKKKISVLTLVLAMILCIQPVSAASLQEAVDAVGATVKTINFDANGGTGSMESISPSSVAALPANTFVRTDFTFTGWNTKANGSGNSYANGAATSQIVQSENKRNITLYAQWKISNAPKLQGLKATSTPGALQVTYTGINQATSYEIQYSTSSNFSKPVTIPVAKGGSAVTSTDFMPGKVNYVRMRSCYVDANTESYSDWSNVLSAKPKKGNTIVNAKSTYAIEADISLKGSGSGYHAKLVIGTANSAVSFGIQYDSCAVAPYTGKAMALIENIASNNPGGQRYNRPKNKSLKRGKTYHFMMTVDKKGKATVYLDYKKLGSVSNSSLKKDMKKEAPYLSIEACARLNGDKVNATFKNIKCKKGGTYDPSRKWNQNLIPRNKGLKKKEKKNGAIVFSGKIKGLPAGKDWDSAYDDVSLNIMFN